jgi:hypothetical protein
VMQNLADADRGVCRWKDQDSGEIREVPNDAAYVWKAPDGAGVRTATSVSPGPGFAPLVRVQP